MRAISAIISRARSVVSVAFAIMSFSLPSRSCTSLCARCTSTSSSATSSGFVTSTRLRAAIARWSTAVRTCAERAARAFKPFMYRENSLLVSDNALSAMPDTIRTIAASRPKPPSSFVLMLILAIFAVGLLDEWMAVE
ncbi:hypothetical protein WT81_09790 [Burkholderia stagnalis]|nr:hypothetical protein WT80_26550 [Burkholderia stagnalis]KWK62099.1 hypothetical protein WT81_09790 [Burkholderia stagnalis]KWN66414.1 hypothetical protein WT90_03885 [Burkholderia stagnalis]